MRSLGYALLAVVLSTSSILCQEGPPVTPLLRNFVAVDAPVVALTHVKLFDGTGVPALDNQTVVVMDGRIQAVGSARDVSIPANAQVLDLQGHTVIPGLVNLHEHTYFGGVEESTHSPASMPLYLAMGVTTAMSAGTSFPEEELSLKRMIDAGQLPGPRLHVSGPYLRGGAEGSGGEGSRGEGTLSSPEDVKRIVDRWAAEGTTWFKFMGAGSREILGELIREAHARGLKVSGHLCSVTFTEASALGIDALQHGFITNSDYVPGKEVDVCPPENMRIQADVDVGSAAVQSTIEEIVANGSAVVSTLGVYETFSPERFRLDPRAMEMLAPETREEVEANNAGMAEYTFNVPVRLLKNMMQWERAFVNAGGLLGAGSDPWGTGYLPGFGNLRNYEMLLEAGFTPEEAIQVMTLNGARILGEDSEFGSVEVGKVADLVLIKGDPEANQTDIYEVVTVFKNGVGFRSDLLRESVMGTIGGS